MTTEVIFSIFLGIALAASAGFRVFIPLFALSIAAHFQLFALSEDWLWLASTPALVILAVASILESLGYLVPFVDNFLDVIALPLAGMAGTLVMASSVVDLNPAATWALAIIAGGGAATAVKATAGAGRVVSTVTSAGVSNSALSMAETGAAVGLSALAIFMPVVAVVVLMVVFITLVWFVAKIKRRAHRH